MTMQHLSEVVGRSERPTPGAVRRLFPGRIVNESAGLISLEAPESVPQGGLVSLSLRVNWSLVLAKAIAHLYVVADRPRDPLLARVALLPDVVPPHVTVTLRLDHSTDISAVVECGDGTVLHLQRRVRVVPSTDPEHAPCANREPIGPLRAPSARTQGGERP
ncbi:MAG TPA: thiosulfate oxidation carrier protein SoxY [Methylomirabilota bacterium]|nr:thiosulfate oxidation carrier protein SoxY [Methylomirabilota bacterium]